MCQVPKDFDLEFGGALDLTAVKSLRTSLLDFNEQALVERLIITLDPYVLPRLLQLPSDTNGERKFKEAMADNLSKRHFDLPAYKMTSLHLETKQLRFLTEELRKFTIEMAFTLSQGQGLLRIKQEPAETQQADSDAEPTLPQLLKAMSALPNLDVPEPDPEPWMISYAWAYKKSIPGPRSDRGSRDMIWSHQQEEPLFISGSRGLPPSPFFRRVIEWHPIDELTKWSDRYRICQHYEIDMHDATFQRKGELACPRCWAMLHMTLSLSTCIVQTFSIHLIKYSCCLWPSNCVNNVISSITSS